MSVNWITGTPESEPDMDFTPHPTPWANTWINTPWVVTVWVGSLSASARAQALWAGIKSVTNPQATATPSKPTDPQVKPVTRVAADELRGPVRVRLEPKWPPPRINMWQGPDGMLRALPNSGFISDVKRGFWGLGRSAKQFMVIVSGAVSLVLVWVTTSHVIKNQENFQLRKESINLQWQLRDTTEKYESSKWANQLLTWQVDNLKGQVSNLEEMNQILKEKDAKAEEKLNWFERKLEEALALIKRLQWENKELKKQLENGKKEIWTPLWGATTVSMTPPKGEVLNTPESSRKIETLPPIEQANSLIINGKNTVGIPEWVILTPKFSKRRGVKIRYEGKLSRFRSFRSEFFLSNETSQTAFNEFISRSNAQFLSKMTGEN